MVVAIVSDGARNFGASWEVFVERSASTTEFATEAGLASAVAARDQRTHHRRGAVMAVYFICARNFCAPRVIFVIGRTAFACSASKPSLARARTMRDEGTRDKARVRIALAFVSARNFSATRIQLVVLCATIAEFAREADRATAGTTANERTTDAIGMPVAVRVDFTQNFLAIGVRIIVCGATVAGTTVVPDGTVTRASSDVRSVDCG